MVFNKGIIKDHKEVILMWFLFDGRLPCLNQVELQKLFNQIDTQVNDTCLTSE